MRCEYAVASPSNFFEREKRMKNLTGLPRRGIDLLAAALTVLCLSLWAGTDAFAQNKGPCADDVAKFCKGVQPGGGAVARCLKEHANELSPSCKEGAAKAKQKVEEFSEACKSDANKFCKQVKPGGGRILQCLKQHENELAPDCKAKMVKSK
jgi:hypothetical protein